MNANQSIQLKSVVLFWSTNYKEINFNKEQGQKSLMYRLWKARKKFQINLSAGCCQTTCSLELSNCQIDLRFVITARPIFSTLIVSIWNNWEWFAAEIMQSVCFLMIFFCLALAYYKLRKFAMHFACTKLIYLPSLPQKIGWIENRHNHLTVYKKCHSTWAVCRFLWFRISIHYSSTVDILPTSWGYCDYIYCCALKSTKMSV